MSIVNNVFIDGIKQEGATAKVSTTKVEVITAKAQPVRKIVYRERYRLGQPTSQQKFRVGRNTTVVTPIRVPDQPGKRGQISVPPATGYSGTIREGWFSWKPGGKPFGHRGKSKVSGANLSMYWTIGDGKHVSRCMLPAGKTIYWNVANEDRAIATEVFINFY